VPISLSYFVITFNQPMYTGGGNRDVTADHYTLINKVTNTKITIVSRTYDPVYYTLTATFSNTSTAWRHDTLYEIQIDNQVANACGTRTGNTITSSFRTEPLTPVTPVPADSAQQAALPNIFTIFFEFIRAISGLWLSVGEQ
jgi:hypothetical protein